jgi:hypothetical protein
VRALVYVAALQPEVGESTNQLGASIPGVLPVSVVQPTPNGFLFIDPARFVTELANDLPAAQARFTADSQMPAAAAAFDAKLTVAAWHGKPSFGIIATDDRTLNPRLARWMYERSGARMTAIRANHLVHVAQPRAVARVIETAARATGQTASP